MISNRITNATATAPTARSRMPTLVWSCWPCQSMTTLPGWLASQTPMTASTAATTRKAISRSMGAGTFPWSRGLAGGEAGLERRGQLVGRRRHGLPPPEGGEPRLGRLVSAVGERLDRRPGRRGAAGGGRGGGGLDALRPGGRGGGRRLAGARLEPDRPADVRARLGQRVGRRAARGGRGALPRHVVEALRQLGQRRDRLAGRLAE